MQSCISDDKAWATVNMPKLNDNKTEFIIVTCKRTKHLNNIPTSIAIGNAQIPLKQPVKHLGSTLDCHLTMNTHVQILHGHATMNFIVWHPYVDSRQAQ